MIVVNKTLYYFDNKDKASFRKFLNDNGITRKDFAKMCNIGISYLSMLFNGKRAITQEIANTFTKYGFKVVL